LVLEPQKLEKCWKNVYNSCSHKNPDLNLTASFDKLHWMFQWTRKLGQDITWQRLILILTGNHTLSFHQAVRVNQWTTYFTIPNPTQG
jgi:hypothetical protein